MALNLILYTGSAVTIGGTELSLTSGTTTIQNRTDNAVISIWIDVNNIAAGDEFEVFLREKAIAGGTQRQTSIAYLVGVQQSGLFITGAFHVGVGWDVTMQKRLGTDRAFSWSIRSAS